MHLLGVSACLPLLAASETNVTSVLNSRRQALFERYDHAQHQSCVRARDTARRNIAARGKALQLPIAAEELESWATDEVERAVSAAVKNTRGLDCEGFAEQLQEDLA